jgi:ferredoxin
VVKATNCMLAGSPALFPPPPPECPASAAASAPRPARPTCSRSNCTGSRARKNFGKAQEYHLFDCIECGCCAYVCPSHIPLVDYYRFAKSEIWARIAFAVMHRFAFPALMSQWPALGLKLTLIEQFKLIAGLAPRIDGMSGATPLDALKTALKLGDGAVDVPTLLATQATFSGTSPGVAGNGSLPAISSAGCGCGSAGSSPGMLPLGFIGGLSLLAAVLWVWSPQQFANPLFHLFSGGAMLGAFFIVTDPFPDATTDRAN